MSAEPMVDDRQTLIQERPPDVFVEQEHGPESHDFQEQLEIPRPLEASLELLRKHTQEQRPSNENEVDATWPTTHYLIRDEHNECQLYHAQIDDTSKYESILAAATTKDSLLRGLLIEALDLQTTTPQPDIKSNSLAQNLSEFGVAVDPESLKDNERLTAHIINEDGTSVSTIEIPPFAIQSGEDDVEKENSTKKEVESVSYRVQLMRTEVGFVFYQNGEPLAGVDQNDPRVQAAIDQLLLSGEATDTEDIESSGISIQTTYYCVGDPNGLAVGESIDVDINSIINPIMQVEPETLDDDMVDRGIEGDNAKNPGTTSVHAISLIPSIPPNEPSTEVTPDKFTWLLDEVLANTIVATKIQKDVLPPRTTTKKPDNQSSPFKQSVASIPIHFTNESSLKIHEHLDHLDQELVEVPAEELLLETSVLLPVTPPIEFLQPKNAAETPDHNYVEENIGIEVTEQPSEFDPLNILQEPLSYPSLFAKHPTISITKPLVAQVSIPQEQWVHPSTLTHETSIHLKRTIKTDPSPRNPDSHSTSKPRRVTNQSTTTAQTAEDVSRTSNLESNYKNTNAKNLVAPEKRARQKNHSRTHNRTTNANQILYTNAERNYYSTSERKVDAKSSARKISYVSKRSNPFVQTSTSNRQSQTRKSRHNNQRQAISLPVSSQDSVRSVLQQSLGREIIIDGENDEPILREQIRPLGVLCEEVTRLLPKYPSINISVSIGYRTVDILPTSDQPLDRLQFIQELQSLSISLSIDQHLTCHYRLGNVQ